MDNKIDQDGLGVRALHAQDVSSPIQHFTAMIALGLPCIASSALLTITTINHYIFLRYSYYNSSTVIAVDWTTLA